MPPSLHRPTALISLLLLSSLLSTTHARDWPTYRGDVGRTGHTDQALPSELSPRWTYRLPNLPRPAWPRSERITDDRACPLVVADGSVFLGSSADGRVHALDAVDGRLRWTFPTEAPIRVAPVAWQDRLFVASDDGYLYALATADGRLLWKHRGGPNDQWVLGNERLVSRWPARGGPVVVEGIVYFAAGIWPSEGIHLIALDATSGEVVWTNDDAGQIEMPQPHGGAVAKSGVSAQGHLIVAGDRLLVPTGRAVPASFDRGTGAFQYFHLQQYGHNGGSSTMAIGDIFFNSGVAFDLPRGQKLFDIRPGPLAATPDGLVRARGADVSAYTLTEQLKPDRRGEPVSTTVHEQRWTTKLKTPCRSLIVADNQIVAGGGDQLDVLDLETGEITASVEVDGTVYSLATTDQGLFASTDRGTIHCFGMSPPCGTSPGNEGRDASPETPYSANSPEAKTAEEIIQRSNITTGYCVDLGCGDGALAYHLASNTDLFICAIDDDPEQVATARDNLIAAGLYGTRVTVYHRELTDTGLPDYLANLIVSARSTVSPTAEIERLQRPYGGITLLGPPGSMTQHRRGPLPGAGRWTHQYADPANTVCSNDQRVKGRLNMLWFRDVDFDMPSRHGRAPAPLFDAGRLFHEGLDGIIALDAYNGHTLWTHEIKGILKPFDGDELMGTAGTGGNLCTADGSVYARHEDSCLRLDAATGEQLDVFTPPPRDDGTTTPWGYLACENGTLIGSLANAEHVVTYRYVNRGGDMTRLLTESHGVFALDVQTGCLKWRFDAEHSIRHNAIALSGGKLFLIDRPLAMFDRQKKPATKEHANGRLVALDAETGDVLWQRDEAIDGTLLAASGGHGVLLMAYQPTRFRLDSERGGRMTAFNTDDGQPLWTIDASYESRPLIIDRTIRAQGGAWDLLDGTPVPFTFQRSYGCGILASGAHTLLFRSATLGYHDLSGSQRTENYGGIRPGCWINAIPAGGLVLLPDATAGCGCSYLTRAWIALQPE